MEISELKNSKQFVYGYGGLSIIFSIYLIIIAGRIAMKMDI